MIPVEILAVLMLVSFFVLLLAGVPVALTLATSGFVFGLLGFGPLLFNLLPGRIFGVVTNSTLLAIPLFVFMGMMLERSRLAEDLMDVIGLAAGSLRGGRQVFLSMKLPTTMQVLSSAARDFIRAAYFSSLWKKKGKALSGQTTRSLPPVFSTCSA